jgi:hypothetical protein
MRRADRLFQIIQILRRSSSPITAAALAAELEAGRLSSFTGGPRGTPAMVIGRLP